MADPQSPNLQLAQPTRGSDVGTWDVPVNGNMSILDQAGGGILTIGLNNSNVTLSSGQYTFKQIVFNSTLTGSVIITFPTSFIKSYEIFNTCTGSSAFTITLQSASSGQIILAPPGECVDAYNDGTNFKFKNLGRIGSYWDYAGSSVPSWVSGCTVPPYLNCDGSQFSATTYPTLNLILGSTTLPNSKGRSRITLDQGAGNISSAVFSGTGVGATGGQQTQSVVMGSSNLPANIPYKDPGHTHSYSGGTTEGVSNPTIQTESNAFTTNSGAILSSTIGITINPSTAAAGTGAGLAYNTVPPTYIGGLTLIRAG